jgi:hypothetical protein
MRERRLEIVPIYIWNEMANSSFHLSWGWILRLDLEVGSWGWILRLDLEVGSWGWVSWLVIWPKLDVIMWLDRVISQMTWSGDWISDLTFWQVILTGHAINHGAVHDTNLKIQPQDPTSRSNLKTNEMSC